MPHQTFQQAVDEIKSRLFSLSGTDRGSVRADTLQFAAQSLAQHTFPPRGFFVGTIDHPRILDELTEVLIDFSELSVSQDQLAEVVSVFKPNFSTWPRRDVISIG